MSATAYTGGQQASVGGVNYKANWWTQGQNPSTNNGPAGSGQPWTRVNVCGAPAPGAGSCPLRSRPAPRPLPLRRLPRRAGPAPTPGLVKHPLVGYWHNFTNPSGPTYPLSQVSNDWNVIVVAFGDDAGNGNVSFTVDPSAGSEAQFIADVRALKAAGKKVVLSLAARTAR